MSSANSPSIAGKLGASFLRKLCKRYPELQGTPVSNTWKTQFTYGAHDPCLDHGGVLTGDDEPPPKYWPSLTWLIVFFMPLPWRSSVLA